MKANISQMYLVTCRFPSCRSPSCRPPKLTYGKGQTMDLPRLQGIGWACEIHFHSRNLYDVSHVEGEEGRCAL